MSAQSYCFFLDKTKALLCPASVHTGCHLVVTGEDSKELVDWLEEYLGADFTFLGQS